jgi:uncharacterized protein YjeT (DUF2065 family)
LILGNSKVPSTKHKVQNLSKSTNSKLRIIGIIFGIAIGAVGGVIAYRALYLEPSAGVVITDTDIRQLPDTARVAGGFALLVIGAAVAFIAARRRTK